MEIVWPVYNQIGNIGLTEAEGTSYGEVNRRIIRKQTINQGVYFDDNGYSEGDRTMSVSTVFTEQKRLMLLDLMNRFSLYEIVTKIGIFSGTIAAINISDDRISFNFLVNERLV